jgi:hypothetical protein
MKIDKSIPTYKSVQLAGKLTVHNGRLVKIYNSPALLRHFFKTHCKDGDSFTETLTNKKPKRSIEQNNYYYLYLDLISSSSGHSVEELALWAKGKFLSKGITEVFGEKTRIVKSSADLNRDEFTEFLNRIEDVTEIPLPDPKPFKLGLLLDEYGKLKIEQKKKYSKMKAKGLPK